MRVIQQGGDAKILVATGTTARTPLPTLIGGTNPKFVLVTCEDDRAIAADAGAVVRLGDDAVIAQTDDGIYVGPGESVILSCGGQAEIAAIRFGSISQDVHIVPLA